MNKLQIYDREKAVAYARKWALSHNPVFGNYENYGGDCKLQIYDREKAVAYARKWALSHNPVFGNYENYGGDCTNFISQCIHAGNIPFDHDGKNVLEKWYWYSEYSRTPTWTAAEPFYKYINFISQCIHAGNIPFDHDGKNVLEKWYWYSEYSRTPTWTAAEPFYKYIIGNNNSNTQKIGIYARDSRTFL